MLTLPLLLIFFAIFAFALGLMPLEARPKLKLDLPESTTGLPRGEPKKEPFSFLLSGVQRIARINRPLTTLPLGKRIYKDLMLSQQRLSVEEFFLLKQALFLVLLWLSLTINTDRAMLPFSILMSIVGGYILPEIWLRAKIQRLKNSILRQLPDTVDLLGLCVNAGLDFMMALKYVTEKSHPMVITEEFKVMMQEINVGKPRRDALRDLARKYEIPELSTFSRTLIQADRMGTSVSEAFNILSEDMREARFRRGETMAMKAPLKMLVPLLFCIFPVVAILVAGPVILDFIHTNPLHNLGK